MIFKLFQSKKYTRYNTLVLAKRKIFNRIKVFGKTEDEAILLMKTEEDTTSQSNLWGKDMVINVNDLTTMDEVQTRADKELTINTNVNKDGKDSRIMLHSLSTREKINIS